VTCKSHIVRRVSRGTHIRPSPNHTRIMWAFCFNAGYKERSKTNINRVSEAHPAQRVHFQSDMEPGPILHPSIPFRFCLITEAFTFSKTFSTTFEKFPENYTRASTVLEGGVRFETPVPFALMSLRGTCMVYINFRFLILNGTEEA
jgi:hypothetical protein